MSVKFYLVGGAVRDRFLGLNKIKDWDFSCEASSYQEMRDAVIAKGWDIKLEKEEYLTIRAVAPKLGGVDIVLCRKDGSYFDGRRPNSVTPGTIYDDLARRDFSAGAIAEDYETGEIIDPWGGIVDISNKLLRCVGKPEERFAEDSLRLIRGVRFSITKGFRLHSSIEGCLRNYTLLELLKNVSKERKREELGKCFAHNTLATLVFLENYPDLRRVLFSEDTADGLWLQPTLKDA